MNALLALALVTGWGVGSAWSGSSCVTGSYPIVQVAQVQQVRSFQTEFPRRLYDGDVSDWSRKNVWQQEQVVRAEPKRAAEPAKAWHWIIFEDMNFPVWGYKTAKNTVIWREELPENTEQLAKARAKKTETQKVQVAEDKNLKPAPSAPDANEKTPLPNGKSAFNYGIEPGKTFANNGYSASGPDAAQFVEQAKGAAPKEEEKLGGKLHLTVIGTKADRGKVTHDLAHQEELKSLKSLYSLQEYGPDAWAVDPALGFDVNGKPSIYLQTHDGKVLYRKPDYQDGPKPLAQALRKADPKYDPKLDPSSGSGLGFLPGLGKEALIGIAVVLAILLMPARSPTPTRSTS